VSFLPPAPIPEPGPPSAPLEATTDRRFRGRDVLTLAAVAAAVWFAVSGAGNGLPFRGSGVDPAPKASAATSAQIAVDRRALMPRPAEAAGDRNGSASQSTGGATKDQTAKQDPKPSGDGDGGGGGGDTTEPPLLEATVPGVGSVTLEDPDLPLPEDTPTTSDLPDTGDVVSDLPTVPLP
jgi:hypothetical protein